VDCRKSHSAYKLQLQTSCSGHASVSEVNDGDIHVSISHVDLPKRSPRACNNIGLCTKTENERTLIPDATHYQTACKTVFGRQQTLQKLTAHHSFCGSFQLAFFRKGLLSSEGTTFTSEYFGCVFVVIGIHFYDSSVPDDRRVARGSGP
jgi:hypothetical protein